MKAINIIRVRKKQKESNETKLLKEKKKKFK